MTKHFSKQELARCFRETGRCSECRLTQPAMKLPYGIEDNLEGLAKEVLEPVRERLGKPIVVNSGFRCPIHNRAVGGATGSQHMKGEAADLRFQDSRFGHGHCGWWQVGSVDIVPDVCTRVVEAAGW